MENLQFIYDEFPNDRDFINGGTLRQKAYLKNAAILFIKQTEMVFDMELQMGSNEFLQLKGMQNYNPSNLEIRK